MIIVLEKYINIWGITFLPLLHLPFFDSNPAHNQYGVILADDTVCTVRLDDLCAYIINILLIRSFKLDDQGNICILLYCTLCLAGALGLSAALTNAAIPCLNTASLSGLDPTVEILHLCFRLNSFYIML